MKKLLTLFAVVCVTTGVWANTWGYTGGIQSYTVPTTGLYKLQVWGAQGGSFNNEKAGGLGGYAYCYAHLTAGETIYIYVGGQGRIGTTASGGAGGWNGGGQGGNGYGGCPGSGGGGGATHISRVNNQVIGSGCSYLGGTNYIIVAGGGGGCGHTYTTPGVGGMGGTKALGTRYNESGYEVTYSSNAYFSTSQSYGANGGHANAGAWNQEGAGGGGGGYWGGTSHYPNSMFPPTAHQDAGGCGGSSYVNYNYVSFFSCEDGWRSGNGQAQIDLMLPGSGTEGDPYQIPSTDVWNNLADLVSLGYPLSGKYFRQTADISVTTPIGSFTDETHFKTFNGIYDGNGKTLTVTINQSGKRYVAPFHYISGATIKNLIVTGSVSVSGSGGVETYRHPAGLVGATEAGSTSLIENCHVSTNVSGSDYIGGIVGNALNSSLTITGCVYSGTLTANNNNYAGGLFGWGGGGSGKTVSIINSLFCGSYSGGGKFHPVGCFYDPDNYTRSVSNTYYTVAPINMTDEDGNSFVRNLSYKGKYAYHITGGTHVTVNPGGTVGVYDVSGISTNGLGLKYNGAIYAANGEIISLELSGAPAYIATTGTLTGSSNPYSLAMTSANSVIKATFQGSGTTLDPYLIPSTAVWNILSTNVSEGNTYSGKFFRQTADISVTTMVGTSSYNFRGTYDGDGHTLTVNYNTTADYTAPFRYIYGATFKNLRTAGTMHVTAKFAGGFAGRGNGANTFYNCRSSVTIDSNREGDGSNGGFIGIMQGSNTSSFEGCVFDGRFVSPNTSRWGGYIGWSDGNVKLSLRNCLFAPTELAMQTTNNLTITRTGDTLGIFTTITNTYYTQLLTNKQAKKACSITGASGVTVANAGTPTEYSVSGITGYNTGLLYGGVLYGGEDETISLNLSGSTNGYYAASTGTLTPSAPYSLTMTEANSVISTAVASVTTSTNVTTYYATFASAVSAWENNSTLTLLADVTTTSTISRTSGTYTLDLNGFGIKMLSATYGGSASGNVFNVGAEGVLTIRDNNATTTHYYTIASPAANGAGLAKVVDEATYNAASGTKGTFLGGYITGGRSTGSNAYGAGIYVHAGGRVNMYGGTIIGNELTGNTTGGGGVEIEGEDTRLYMYDGNIIGNRAAYGGAVYVRNGRAEFHDGLMKYNVAHQTCGGAVHAYNSNSYFTMYGGTISNNIAACGGAFEASGSGNITLAGGSIMDNIATERGGALTNRRVNDDSHNAVFNLSGNVVFSGNARNSNAEQIFLSNTVKLHITGALTNANSIGVAMTTPGVFTTGYSAHNSAHPSTYFHSENAGYIVGLNTSGEAYLHTPYTVTYDGNGATADVPSDVNTYAGRIAVAIPSAAPTKTGYTFSGWYNSVDGMTYAAGESFSITANTTLTAQWTINQYTISFDSDGGSAVDPITQDYGTAVAAPADPTKSGYTFIEWSQAVPATMPATDMNLVAQWSLNHYTITYDLDGGDATNPTEYTIESADITLANPTKAHFVFLGWTGSNGSTPEMSVTIAQGSTGDKNYTANWEAAPYATFTAPTAITGLIYDGEMHTLVNGGTATGGTMEYQVDGGAWSELLPQAAGIGDHTVSYRVIGDENHTDVPAASIIVNIAPVTVLYDNVNPTVALTGLVNSGAAFNITINRTIYADGFFNTICLPFGVTASDLADASHPLYGYSKLLAFTGADVTGSGQNIFINIYAQDASEMTAGVPYLISYPSNHGDIINPTFSNVVCEEITPSGVRYDGVTFQGLFGPHHITTYEENVAAGTDDYLFLGANNRLLWPNDDGTSMRGFRAYFILHRADIPIGRAPRGSNARIITRENTATDIESIQPSEVSIQKILRDGQIIIIRGDKEYTVDGKIVNK